MMKKIHALVDGQVTSLVVVGCIRYELYITGPVNVY
jgi:hypothetical protein